jgi:plastocyanin
MKSLLSLLLFFILSVAESKTIAIKIEAMKFTPNNVNAKVGDTIEWDNKDFFPHTATALDNSFNSNAIPSMKSWSLKVKKPGTFKYKCIFHPNMFGSFVVK